MKSLHRFIRKWQAVAALLVGLRERALAIFETQLAAEPDDVQAMASRAHLLAELGRQGEALAQYRALTSTGRARGAHWFNQGFLEEVLGELEAAERSFRQALALQDDLDRAWYGLGLVLIRLQRPDEAVAALRRNTELQPMSPHGWYQLARIHVERQESDEAKKIILHLKGFEPKVAAQLERETGLTVQAA